MSEEARQLRRQRRSWAHPGSIHDKMVRAALVVLPICIGVLAAFLVMAPLTTGGDVSFVLDKNRVDVADERMRVQAATYRGRDSRGRPFVLQAGSAVQKSSSEPVVEMRDLAAQIRLQDGPAMLRAPSGSYDMDAQTVAVNGPVRFRTADGYDLNANGAKVDLRDQQLTSDGPVTGSTPMGNFSGDSLRADLEERTVTLEGNARLRIVPGRANRR